MTTAGDLLKSGKLKDAVDAATASVKSNPKDLEARWLSCSSFPASSTARMRSSTR